MGCVEEGVWVHQTALWGSLLGHIQNKRLVSTDVLDIDVDEAVCTPCHGYHYEASRLELLNGKVSAILDLLCSILQRHVARTQRIIS